MTMQSLGQFKKERNPSKQMLVKKCRTVVKHRPLPMRKVHPGLESATLSGVQNFGFWICTDYYFFIYFDLFFGLGVTVGLGCVRVWQLVWVGLYCGYLIQTLL